MVPLPQHTTGNALKIPCCHKMLIAYGIHAHLHTSQDKHRKTKGIIKLVAYPLSVLSVFYSNRVSS